MQGYVGAALSFIALLCWSANGLTAEAITEKDPHPAITFQRADEVYRFLADPSKRTDPFDGLKYIPLGDDPNRFVSVAGSARFRYNYYAPDLFGLGKTGTTEGGILLERYLLSTDWHLRDDTRIFFELGQHVAQDTNFPAGPNDQDQWDINQVFMDLSGSLGGIDGRARVGRQYVVLGSSRLVGLRDGPNVRERFDGGRLTFKDNAGNTVEALALRDVVTSLGAFDDSSTHGDELWGVYAVLKKHGATPSNIDLYYLGLDRSDSVYARGVANERRHSFGTRVWGEKDGWDWNWEAVLQTGTFGNTGIAAWTVASITGYTFAARDWKPRVFLSANIASGDNPKGRDLGTFNPLFPRLPYFEEAGFLAPENFKNLQPGLQFKLTEKVQLGIDWNFFWRENNHDAVYVRGLRPLAGTKAAQGSFVADIATLSAQWQVSRNILLEGGYSHFFAGDVITHAAGKDSDFAYSAVTLAF